MKNKVLSIGFSIFSILFIIAFSIALPIYARPFYYAHIDAYNLEEATGKSEAQIKDAYDEILDYLTLQSDEFSSGEFSCTDEVISHFDDCKVLFNINLSVLIISFLGIVVLLILNKKSVFKMLRPFGKHISFTIGSVNLLLFALIGVLCSINVDKAFVIFHKIFFYGKDNWIFDFRTDEIVLALPQEFFINCAILIVSSIFVISVALICYCAFWRKNK